MAIADDEPIEIIIVDGPKPPKARHPDEPYDIWIAHLMQCSGTNFYGLYRLKDLRAFLERVAGD